MAYFDARKYDPAGVRDLIGRFKHLLDAVLREPDVPINELLGIPADQLRERALEYAKCERARFLEQHRALRTQLQELEADRAARLKVIEALTDRINQLEDDRALQLTTVVDRLNEFEADRAARLKVIEALTDQLKESEAGRASVNGFIRSILSSLRNHNKPMPH